LQKQIKINGITLELLGVASCGRTEATANPGVFSKLPELRKPLHDLNVKKSAGSWKL